MHPYQFLQRYGPTALVMEVTDTLGEAFASELAKGGFDLFLPCAETAALEPLAARLRDHEGVNVELYAGDIESPRFVESLYPACEAVDIGLLVCGLENDHPRMAGSLLSSLTRVFGPRLRDRQHSAVVLLDTTGKARRLGESLAQELKPTGTEVLVVCVDPAAAANQTSARELAKLALEGVEDGPVMFLPPQAELDN